MSIGKCNVCGKEKLVRLYKVPTKSGGSRISWVCEKCKHRAEELGIMKYKELGK